MAHDAVGVNEDKYWDLLHVVASHNPAFAVPPGAPGECVPQNARVRLGGIGIDVYAQSDERLILELLDERPLVGKKVPAGRSEMGPETEQHHLPALVA